MSRPKVICFTVATLLIGGTAGLLSQVRSYQKLGLPGIRTHPIPGSIRLQADLPERVLDYSSELKETDNVTLTALPADTSFGLRHYSAPDGFQLNLQVVLMGTDRTSLHKPQFCLPGSGWQIDNQLSGATTIAIDRPIHYNLPVVKLIARTERTINGEIIRSSAVYVYWYVCDDACSASVSGFERMWLSADRLLRTGVLQRWAYISCLATCAPGQEDATFARLSKFITAAVPAFQLTPKNPIATVSAVNR